MDANGYDAALVLGSFDGCFGWLLVAFLVAILEG